MEEWKEYKLGEVADCTLGKMLDQRKNKGKPRTYLGNVAVRWGSFNIDPSQKMLIEDEEISKYELKFGDIVICEGGEPGRCAIWESDSQIFIQKALHRVRVRKGVANNYFIYYCFRNLVKQGRIEPYCTGSTIKHLPRERLVSLSLCLPSLPAQKKIASILKSLDDKIEVNRRINDNLEKQAIAIFDQMFPDISRGDNMIGDIIVPKRGKGLLSKNAIEGSIPVVAGGINPATYHNTANTEAPVITIAASGANAGYVNLWHKPVWCSDSSYIDSSMTPDVYFWYIILKKRQKEIFDAQVGSAQPHIYPKHIAEMPLGRFSDKDVLRYTERVKPMFELIGIHKEPKSRSTLI